MKHVYIQPRTAPNGRCAYDLLNINGGLAGGDEIDFATLGEAYEAGIRHVEAALLKDAYYELCSFRSFANAGFVVGNVDGLTKVISETEKMLFI